MALRRYFVFCVLSKRKERAGHLVEPALFFFFALRGYLICLERLYREGIYFLYAPVALCSSLTLTTGVDLPGPGA